MKLLIALALAAAPSALAMAPYVPDDEGPTAAPTLDPTAAPTKDPTPAPTKEPTPAPTKAPVAPIPGPSWTRVMNAGSISQFSEVCTSYNTWRGSLTGAETSITVSGIRYVVDCGLVKQKSCHPQTGLEVAPRSSLCSRYRQTFEDLFRSTLSTCVSDISTSSTEAKAPSAPEAWVTY